MATRKVEFYRHTVGADELASLKQTVDSLFLTLGPRVRELEGALADYVGGGVEAVGVSSCTVGLFLTLRAFDIGAGDEVISTPMTFVATTNAVIHAGATPVFADIDPRTGLLDPAEVEKAITPKTRAIIAVHLYGQMSDMRALRGIADRHGLFLLEDSAHGIEGMRDGYRAGHLGDAAVLSFYATKTMTSGDGGAILIRDPERAARLRILRNHGMSKDAAARHGGTYQHWDMLELGYKGALTDVEAAMLLPQLARVDAQRNARQCLVERYEGLLRDEPAVQLVEWSGRSTHHIFALLVPVEQRDRVLRGLGERGIGCAVNYNAVHTLRYYRERLGDQNERLPSATDFGRRTISLPLWPEMPEDDVDYVAQALLAELSES
jgi:UDP-4-amino-4-deoxy-L-arabinose-oxoglutarate aminotransferase